MRESIFKGFMDAMKECQKREIKANAVFISDPLFFSRITTYPGEVPMVCGLSAYYDAGLPDDVLFAVARVERERERAEVRRGEWINPRYNAKADMYIFTCDQCLYGCTHSYAKDPIWDYCPNCGARMNGRGYGDG